MRMLVKNEKLQTFVLLVLILFLVTPYIAACFYAFPYMDDYNHYAIRYEYTVEHGDDPLNAFTQAAVGAYQNGFVFSLAILYLFNPLKLGGIVLLRVFLCVNLMLFILSLLVLSVKVCRYFMKAYSWRDVFFLTASFCVFFFCLQNYREVYFYYTVSISYLVAITAVIFACVFLLDYAFDRRWIKLVLSTVLAAFAASNSINIAALCCVFLLGTTVWALFIKKTKPIAVVPLLVAAGVGLLYLLMPGPTNRAGKGTLDYVAAFRRSASIVFGRAGMFCTDPLFLALLIAFVLFLWRNVGTPTNGKFLRHPTLALLIAFFASVIATYPVILGYSGWFPDRCAFVTDVALFFGFLFVAAYVVLFLKTNDCCFQWKSVVKKRLSIFTCLLVAVCVLNSGYPMGSPFVLLYKEILCGKLEANRRVWQDQLDSLEEQKGQNVHLFIDPDVVSRFIYYPGYALPVDPDDIFNRSFALYHGVAAVTVDMNYDFSAPREAEE